MCVGKEKKRIKSNGLVDFLSLRAYLLVYLRKTINVTTEKASFLIIMKTEK